MGGFNIYPTTILGKIRTRTPTQAQALSSRYVFLNIKNAEPNLGRPPGIFGGTYTSSLTSGEYLGIRYALLSNNHSGSAWRVWAYDNPRIAAYSKEGSLGIGDNAYPLNIKSFVYSNYAYDNQNNRYNSQSFSEKTFNIFSLSGIYLFNATTIGDPASAIEFIVTEEGNVGIGVEDPAEKLTVNGNISANGSLFVRDLSANNLTVSGNISASGNLTINGNTTLGDTNTDATIIRGIAKIADSSQTNGILFGSGDASYDVNLYRSAADTLKTDDSFIVNAGLTVNSNTILGSNSTDQATINAFAAFNATRTLVAGSNTYTFSLTSSDAIVSTNNMFVLNTTNFPTRPFRAVFTDGGNFRTNTESTMIFGTNQDQHLRFRTGGSSNNEIRMTILSSGEVGIGTTLAQTSAAGTGGLTVIGNISARGLIAASTSDVGIVVNNKTANYTFTNADNNKIIHLDTTVQTLTAVFPATLRTDFNCAVMNTGTNSLRLSAEGTVLKAIGNTITQQYGSAFVYKDSANNVYAVGRL